MSWRSDRGDAPRYRLLVQLAAWCALRFGELTELRRGDVDTRAGVIRIRRAVVLVDGRFVVKEPKSEAGIRDVKFRRTCCRWCASTCWCIPRRVDGLLFPPKNDPSDHLRQSR